MFCELTDVFLLFGEQLSQGSMELLVGALVCLLSESLWRVPWMFAHSFN